MCSHGDGCRFCEADRLNQMVMVLVDPDMEAWEWV